MELFGLFTLLALALALSREYSKFVAKREMECKGFLLFVGHMHRQVSSFLKTPREICAGFSCEAIEPFLLALLREDNIFLAYESTRSAFSLSSEVDTELSLLFSYIGSCYAEEGVRLLSGAEERLRVLSSECEANGGRSRRLFSTLCAAGALGIFILVI